MTDDNEGIDPETLQRRLPGGWEVSTDARAVYGRTETFDPEEVAPGVDPTTQFTIRPAEGSLWRASWKPPVGPGHGALLITDQITGTKERCVEWVVEKANGTRKDQPETDPDVEPAETSVGQAPQRDSAEIVYDWMNEAPRDELTDFLATVAPEQFFDEHGEPREVFLDESGGWQAGEVFTALWEGRSIEDAGNVEAFRTALALAEARFDGAKDGRSG